MILHLKVLKDKTDEISKMNDYVVNPAKLIVKDGKKYIEMTLKIVRGLRNSKRKTMNYSLMRK